MWPQKTLLTLCYIMSFTTGKKLISYTTLHCDEICVKLWCAISSCHLAEFCISLSAFDSLFYPLLSCLKKNRKWAPWIVHAISSCFLHHYSLLTPKKCNIIIFTSSSHLIWRKGTFWTSAATSVFCEIRMLRQHCNFSELASIAAWYENDANSSISNV